MSNVQIEILDSSNSIQGRLDLKDNDKFPLSITKKSGNIADITSRSGTFSTSFAIPSTSSNNKLLNSFYHAGTKNTKEYFVKKDAIILVDGNVFQRGKIRIERVSADGTNKEYKAVFFGDNAEWIKTLEKTYLSDIGLDSTVTLTMENAITSWDNTSTSDEYVLSFMDRGMNRTPAKRGYDRTQSSQINWENTYPMLMNCETVNPDLFVKQILKKSFNSIGYNFNSSFFDADGSALIHSEINENYGKKNTSDNYLEAYVPSDVSYTFTGSTYGYREGYPSEQLVDDGRYMYRKIPTTTVTSDVNNNFDESLNTTTYTVPREGLYDIDIDINITISRVWNTTNGYGIPNGVDDDFLRPHVVVYKDDIASQYELEPVGLPRLYSASIEPVGALEPIEPIVLTYNLGEQICKYSTKDLYLLEGDKIHFAIVFQTIKNINDAVAYTGSTYAVEHTTHAGTTLKITEKSQIVRNNTFNLKDVVDSKSYPILSLIGDYTKAFNLYWRTDNKTKTVYCEPRDSFYDSLANAENWTQKIDISKYELTPLASGFARNLEFNYRADSRDKFLKARNDEMITNWGSYKHDLGVNFRDSTLNIMMNVYAPTYFKSEIEYTHIDGGFTTSTGAAMSRAWNESTVERPEYDSGFLPRLLNFTKKTNEDTYSFDDRMNYFTQEADKLPERWNYTDGGFGVFNTLIRNTTASHVVKTIAKSNLSFSDLVANSGTVVQTGLFVNHYAKTFDLITTGFILTIKANLTPTEITNFKISDVIYFSAPEEIKGYWVIQSMSNIKPMQEGLVTLTLLQHKSFEPIVSSQPDGGGKTEEEIKMQINSIKFGL